MLNPRPLGRYQRFQVQVVVMATAGKHTATTPSGEAIPTAPCQDVLEWFGWIHPIPQLTKEMRLRSSGAYARAPPVPKLPAGLVELMEDLTRDVLRHNPTNVYEFCAGHMEKLLEIRDGRAPKPVLTLEQKIAKVQEKLNKTAELRTQKYDKQMQLYRLNSKLKQTSEQREDQMGSSRPTNSSEIYSNEDISKAKQTTATFSEKNQTLHMDIVENKSKKSMEQELNTKNNIQDFFPTHDKEANKVSVETNPGLDVNNSKDSIEIGKHAKQDIEMLDKLEESVTDLVIRKSEDKVETLEEKSFMQDVKINEKVEEGNLNLVDDITVLLHVKKDEAEEKDHEKDNEMKDGTESIKSIQVVNENINLVIVENNPEDSLETLKKIMEIKKQEELVVELIVADQTTPSDTVEDKSKGPVHHEQDLADDLEVEIFHKQSEPKKESMTASTETCIQTANDKFESGTDPYNIETGSLKKEKVNRESSEEGLTKNNSSCNEQEDLSKTDSFRQTRLTNLKREFLRVDDHLKPSEVNLSECTDAGNDTANSDANLLENEKVAKSEIPGAMTQEKDSDIDLEIIDSYSASSSKYKTDNLISVAMFVDKVGSDIKQHPDEGVEEPLENIFNNDVARENDNIKRKVPYIKYKSPSDEALEKPMQKKEYALLLPEIGADSETELKPITLQDGTHGKNLIPDNIDIIVNTSTNENIVTSIEEFANVVKGTDGVETTSIIKDIKSSVDSQKSETTDNPKEKSENGPEIENKFIENVVINTKEHNLDCENESKAETKELNSDSQDQEFNKVFSDKHNETVISSDGIEIDSETAKLGEKSGDVTEISSYSDLTHKTETPIGNDSADESTVGDSNDGLMDQDVEIVTQSEEIKNPSTMDLETAAVTIQKVFRSFLFKSRCSTFEDTSTDEANPMTDDDNDKEEVEYPIAKDRRVLGITRMDTVLQTVNEEKSLSLSTDDSSTLSSAATVIQAHVKGFLTRNKFNSHKTTSNASLVNSDGPSTHTLEAVEGQKKTILNIHIVPEGDHFLSRDESIITSMDLSLDGTSPSSVNLHPLGYDKSEPRKQLKREDAIQSISPPSNNSGKLSEDIDSVKEIDPINVSCADTDLDSDTSPTKSSTLETVIETIKGVKESSVSSEPEIGAKESDVKRTLTKMSSDEGDVVTPFEQGGQFSTDSDHTSGLLHSGEFHDIVLPTTVARSDTSVVRGE